MAVYRAILLALAAGLVAAQEIVPHVQVRGGSFQAVGPADLGPLEHLTRCSNSQRVAQPFSGMPPPRGFAPDIGEAAQRAQDVYDGFLFDFGTAVSTQRCQFVIQLNAIYKTYVAGSVSNWLGAIDMYLVGSLRMDSPNPFLNCEIHQSDLFGN